MTIRSEGQFNTVVYEEEDIYRGQDRRDVILMNRADIDRLGLAVDQRVTVTSEAARSAIFSCAPSTSGQATRRCTIPRPTCSSPGPSIPRRRPPRSSQYW